MAGCEIHSVYAGIAGSHVRSLNSHGVVGVRDKEVTQADVEHVIDAAKAVAIPADQRSCTCCRRSSSSTARRASAIRSACRACASRPRCTSSPAPTAPRRTSSSACSAAGSRSTTWCSSSSPRASPSSPRTRRSSAFAWSTSAAAPPTSRCSASGAIRHTAVIPIAGDQVTNDIAVSMRTPTQYAEDIKIRYACALSQLANPDESIEVPSVGERPGAPARAADARRDRRAALRGAVRPDARGAAAQRLRGSDRRRHRAHRRQRQAWKGAIELAEEVFHVPVRLGVPQAGKGLADVVRNPDLFHRRGAAALRA